VNRAGITTNEPTFSWIRGV